MEVAGPARSSLILGLPVGLLPFSWSCVPYKATTEV